MEKGNLQANTQASNPVFTDADLSSTPSFLSYISFSIKDFLYWWYIQMPIYYIKKLSRISTVISDQLSIGLLLKNFFIPWKRHRAAVGYFIGIMVKLFYLPIAFTLYLTAISTYCALIFIWLIIPLIAIFFTFISLFL